MTKTLETVVLLSPKIIWGLEKMALKHIGFPGIGKVLTAVER